MRGNNHKAASYFFKDLFLKKKVGFPKKSHK